MIIIKVTDGIEKALKQYKSKIFKIKQIQELKERQSYKKKSVTKRDRLLKSKIRQKFKLN